MKLKLKRKISGKRIRQIERQKRIKEEGKPDEWTVYNKNIIHGQKKRDNPNLLDGDTPVYSKISDIRLPKKGRKTAWKRFKKSFPFIQVTKSGGKRLNEQKLKEFYDSSRSKKKSRRI
jgi:hypothetical protein